METSDQGYVVSGNTYISGLSSQFWLFKTDFDGNTIGYTAVENELNQSSGLNITLFPNPANNACKIRYTLNTETSVDINIYNLLGAVVWRKSLEKQLPGSYNINWETISQYGTSLPSGIYIATISSQVEEQYVKVTLLK